VVLGAVLLTALPGGRESLAGLVSEVSRGDGAAVRDTIQSYGVLAPAFSVALALLHIVVPFPAEMLALANGLAFGFWGGLAVTWTGFMLAALLTYAAGRVWGRPLLERFVSDRHRKRLDGWLEREGAFPLLAMRLIPLVPFNALCLGAGTVRAPLWTYVWTTGVGILPLGAFISYLGSQMGATTPHLGAPFWALSAALLATVLGAWWVHVSHTK
jgi:uncharacterized membrane protein YdjX (TVP38/TMEM64 family)